MRKIKIFFIFLFILFGCNQKVMAGEYSYQCIVVSISTIQEDGKTNIQSQNLNIGKRFAIDKKTGSLTGDVFFAAFPFTTPQIIAKGSRDSSFKVLWLSKAGGKDGAHSELLVVQEYLSQPKKPFSHFTGTMLISGLCD
jgi:hypothetical protein